jgi:hypothetical protein
MARKPLPPELAARAVRLYRRKRRIGIDTIAWELGFWRWIRVLSVNPHSVVDALQAAGVQLRTNRTWDPRSRKWLLHKTPSPEVAAELAAWDRYVAYVRVMTDRHRRSKRGHRKPWPPDHKARHLAALWLEARAKRPRRKPRPFDQRTRDYFRRYDLKRRAIQCPPNKPSNPIPSEGKIGTRSRARARKRRFQGNQAADEQAAMEQAFSGEMVEEPV